MYKSDSFSAFIFDIFIFLFQVSPRNLALLLQTYMARNDLGLAREIASNGKPLLGSTRTLKMPVLVSPTIQF